MGNTVTLQEFSEELCSLINDNIKDSQMFDNCEVKSIDEKEDAYRLVLSSKKDDHENKICISPTFYVNDIYDNFIKRDDITIEQIAENLIKSIPAECPNVDMNILRSMSNSDYDAIREELSIKVEHKDVASNTGISPDVVSIDFMGDMVMYLMIDLDDNASCRITRTMIEKYAEAGNIDYDSMLEIAKNNALDNLKKKKFVSTTLNDIVTKFDPNIDPNGLPSSFMTIVTSEDGTYGANIMSVIQDIDMTDILPDEEFIIIPSSVHELIFIPKDYIQNVTEDINIESIHDMIRSVNDTQLSARDLLSYHVYKWDGYGKPITLLM